MDAEDVLKENCGKLRKELEAKVLLREIDIIFSPSTAQEIACTIDRDGSIAAVDMILKKMPLRDNWVEVFYNALNGKVINKPKLAQLFEPFINKDSNYERQLQFSLGTCLKNIPYFQTLKDFYPDEAQNWEYYIQKNDLPSKATLNDFMDNIYVRNKDAYEQIKKEIKIKHSFIRQATREGDVTDQKSLPLSKVSYDTDSVPTPSTAAKVTPSKPVDECPPAESNRKNSTLTPASSNFQQSYLPPMREVIYQQEKAFKNIDLSQAQDISAKSVPTTFAPSHSVTVDKGSTISLPVVPASGSRGVDESKNDVSGVEDRGPDNSSRSSETSSPTESNEENAFIFRNLSVLALAIALGFWLGIYYSRK